MRRSLISICSVVLMFCLWLLLHRIEPTKNNPAGVQAAQTNQQSATPIMSSNQTQNADVPNVPNIPKIPPSPPFQAQTPEELHRRILADWQRPIEFYGKVVDENTNPVEGANITFGWSETPSESGEMKATTQSDAEGLFSLHGKHGPSLEVWFSKEGYYTSHGGQWGFSYTHSSDKYVPDSSNPVIFLLHTKGKGESLITTAFPTGMGQIAQLHHNGTPVELDLFKGAEVPVGSGQLKLEFWRAITNQNANIYDWKCQLTVSGGGLVETPDEFAFQAPESGYQSSIVIDMPATNQTWLGEVRSKYYIQLPDGKYGRIDFYLLPYNGVFTVSSAINPSGSRNLEPQ